MPMCAACAAQPASMANKSHGCNMSKRQKDFERIWKHVYVLYIMYIYIYTQLLTHIAIYIYIYTYVILDTMCMCTYTHRANIEITKSTQLHFGRHWVFGGSISFLKNVYTNYNTNRNGYTLMYQTVLSRHWWYATIWNSCHYLTKKAFHWGWRVQQAKRCVNPRLTNPWLISDRAQIVRIHVLLKHDTLKLNSIEVNHLFASMRWEDYGVSGVPLKLAKTLFGALITTLAK